MSYSFKRKLKILNSILQKYKKYINNCIEIRCYVDREFIIIEKINDIKEKRNATIKIPTKDIDIIIKRERAKLYQVKNKSYKK